MYWPDGEHRQEEKKIIRAMTVYPAEDMDVFKFMAIHPIVVDTFYSKPHVNLLVMLQEK